MTQVKIFENETHLEKAINDWLSKHSNTTRNIKIKPLGISPSGDIKVMVIYDRLNEKEDLDELKKITINEIRDTLYNYSKAHRGVNAYV